MMTDLGCQLPRHGDDTTCGTTARGAAVAPQSEATRGSRASGPFLLAGRAAVEEFLCSVEVPGLPGCFQRERAGSITVYVVPGFASRRIQPECAGRMPGPSVRAPAKPAADADVISDGDVCMPDRAGRMYSERPAGRWRCQLRDWSRPGRTTVAGGAAVLGWPVRQLAPADAMTTSRIARSSAGPRCCPRIASPISAPAAGSRLKRMEKVEAGNARRATSSSR